jgi:hypothetical protein
MSSENNLALQRPLLTDGPHSIPMDSFRWGGGNLIKTICLDFQYCGNCQNRSVDFLI